MATKRTKRKLVHGEGGGAKPSKLSFFNPRTMTPKTQQQKLECFICNMFTTMDLDFLNMHISDCIKKRMQSSHQRSDLEEEPERPLFFPSSSAVNKAADRAADNFLTKAQPMAAATERVMGSTKLMVKNVEQLKLHSKLNPLGDSFLTEGTKYSAMLRFLREGIRFKSTDDLNRAFEEMWKFASDHDVKYPPNPKNPSVNLLHRRFTLGGSYSFAGTTSVGLLVGDEANWPLLARDSIEFARNKSELPEGVDYNVAHVNLYDGMREHLVWHADDERQAVQGAPVWSFTFLSANGEAREFQVSK